MATKLITPELVTAYWFCPRKAFFLLRGDDSEPVHEYISVINQRADRNRHTFLATNYPSCLQFDHGERNDVIAGAILKVSNFEAKIDALVRENHGASGTKERAEPYLAVGTAVTTKDQQIHLAAAGHVLAKALRYAVPTGVILNTAGKKARIKLDRLDPIIDPIIKILECWVNNLPSEPPPIILNSHCQVCPYKRSCRNQAEREDNLSLLDRMTPKLMNRLQRKGIFTVNQLSYLYKPRRNRKRRKRRPLGFDFALQALALRNRKIYVYETPSIPVQETEIFLDIEGLPDLAFDYLIGIIVVSATRVERYSLWADMLEDERRIFESLLRIVEDHPAAPIYHYGNYELKRIISAAKKYNITLANIEHRLINVTSFIFGKIYFPTRSNSLKDVGKYVGATWSIQDASGLLSIAWRLQWDLSKDVTLKQKIMTYNIEDCEALRVLVSELRCIGVAASERDDVDFADVPKQKSTTSGQSIHNSLEIVIKSAHAVYNRKRLGLRVDVPEGQKRHTGGVKGHQGFKRIIPKPNKIVGVRRPIKCPEHKGQQLEASEESFSITIIDLVFMRSGARKTITKYIGRGGTAVCVGVFTARQ